MKLDERQREDLGVALNEATLLGAEVDVDQSMAFVTFDVLTLPPDGPPPDDRRVQFVFHPVGRVAASLRMGHWDDRKAEVVRFDLEELLHIVEGLKQPIYGWEFFDLDKDFKQWEDRLSLDYRSKTGQGLTHSITLFQEGGDRHLDLRIWFDSFGLRDGNGGFPNVEDFIAGGIRWWKCFYDGDPRTDGEGLVLRHKNGKVIIPPGIFDKGSERAKPNESWFRNRVRRIFSR